MKKYFVAIFFLITVTSGAFSQNTKPVVVTRQTPQQQAQHLYNEALSSYKHKKYDAAIGYLNSALKIYDSFKEAYILMANIYQDKGSQLDAIKTCMYLVDKIQQKDSAYYLLSKIYFDMKNYNSSLEYAQKAIDFNASDYKTHYLKGLNNFHQQQYESAITNFSAAISLKDNSAEIFNDRGSANYLVGNYQEAVADYDKAVKINSISLYYNNRGNAQYASGNIKEAIEDFSTAIQLDDNSYQAYINRGIAQLASLN